MKIGFLMGYFLPVPAVQGGAMEKTAAHLASQLAARGNDVGIISRTWPGFPDRETLDGVTHLRRPGFPHSRSLARNLIFDALWCARTLRASRAFDVLVTNSVLAPILFPRLLGSRTSIVPWIARMPKGQTRFYGGATSVVAVSGAVKRRLLAENDALAEKILTIPLSIDWHRFAQAPRKPDSKRTVIGYTGRIHPLKGLDLLLEAAALITERSPDLPPWELRLFGPETVVQGGAGPDYRAALQARWGGALGDRLHWGGFLGDPDQLAAACSQMDIFCYPSLDETGETFGVAAAEAMAAGCAPVVSSLDCFTDFIAHGQNGRRFDHRAANAAALLAEALEELLGNKELTQQTGSAAQRDVRRLDHPEVAGVWCVAMEKVFESRQ